MRLKIVDGTAEQGDPSLCLTRHSATIIKGQRLRDEIVNCGRPEEGRIAFCGHGLLRIHGQPPRFVA